MEFYKGMMVGLFIGVLAGAFLLGLMQMIKRKDDIYEKLILEQGRKNGKRFSSEPADYFDHFNAHRDRRVCPERRSESGKVSNIDYRLLQHVDGHLGVSKGSGR
jgi:hypothetical protein